MRPFNLVYGLFLFPALLKAQLPDTEIWLFQVNQLHDSLYTEKPSNITKRSGYDNQPSFSVDQKRVYFVSVKEDRQADIYYYDLRSKKVIQFTSSSVSEYSPQETKKGLVHSVVVERDSAQRLHRINVATGLQDSYPEPDSVGYYCFLNSDSLIYYKVGEPHSINLFSFSSGNSSWLGNNPVRGFRRVNRHTCVFGIKDSTGVNFYLYDFLIQKAVFYCHSAKGTEDIIWHPQLGLVRSEGLRLFRFLETSGSWSILFDLSGSGLHRISRFDLDDKLRHLVVVDNLSP